jgi:hypothetical protein
MLQYASRIGEGVYQKYTKGIPVSRLFGRHKNRKNQCRCAFVALLLHCFYGFATANMGATVGQKYGNYSEDLGKNAALCRKIPVLFRVAMRNMAL